MELSWYMFKRQPVVLQFLFSFLFVGWDRGVVVDSKFYHKNKIPRELQNKKMKGTYTLGEFHEGKLPLYPELSTLQEIEINLCLLGVIVFLVYFSQQPSLQWSTWLPIAQTKLSHKMTILFIWVIREKIRPMQCLTCTLCTTATIIISQHIWSWTNKCNSGSYL